MMNSNGPRQYGNNNIRHSPSMLRGPRRQFQYSNNGDNQVYLDITTGQATTWNAVLRNPNTNDQSAIHARRVVEREPVHVRDRVIEPEHRERFLGNNRPSEAFEGRPRTQNNYARHSGPRQIPQVPRMFNPASHVQQRLPIVNPVSERETSPPPPPLRRLNQYDYVPRANVVDDDQPPRLFPQTESHTPERETKANIGLIRNLSQGRGGPSPAPGQSRFSNDRSPRIMRLRCKYRPLHAQYTQPDPSGQDVYVESNGDVEFICADGKLYAHRVLLCCSSTFFVDMFKDQDHRDYTHISVPDVKIKYLRTVLTLAYTNEIKINVNGSQLEEIEKIMELFGFKRNLFKVTNAAGILQEPRIIERSPNYDTGFGGSQFGGSPSRLLHPRKATHLNRSFHRTATQPLNTSLPSNQRNMKFSPTKNMTHRQSSSNDYEFDNNAPDEVEEVLDNDTSVGRGRDYNRWIGHGDLDHGQPGEENAVDSEEFGPGEDFRCNVCRTRFTDRVKYQYHQARHTRHGVYSCQYENCQEDFPTLVTCTRHERDEHEPPIPRRRRRPSGGSVNMSGGKRPCYGPGQSSSSMFNSQEVVYMAWDDNAKTSDNIFICAGCGKATNKQDKARQHYNNCGNCRNIRREVGIEKRKRGFVGDVNCHICHRSFIKNLGFRFKFTIHCGHKHGSFRKLFNYDTQTDKLQCATCHVRFNEPVDLGAHLEGNRTCGTDSADYSQRSNPIPSTSAGSSVASAGGHLTGSIKRKAASRQTYGQGSVSPYSRTKSSSSSYSTHYIYDPPHTISPTLSRSARLAERQRKNIEAEEPIPTICPICNTLEEHIEDHLNLVHPDLGADVMSVDKDFLHCSKCSGRFLVIDLLSHLDNCRSRKGRRGKANGATQDPNPGPTDENGKQATSIVVFTPGMSVTDLVKCGLQCGICSRVEKRITDATQCLGRHGWIRCSMCFNCYSKRTALDDHMKKEHTNLSGEYECPLCSKTGTAKIGMSTHMHSAHWLKALGEVLDQNDWTPSLCRSMYRRKKAEQGEAVEDEDDDSAESDEANVNGPQKSAAQLEDRLNNAAMEGGSGQLDPSIAN